jgi:hypothetical protein
MYVSLSRLTRAFDRPSHWIDAFNVWLLLSVPRPVDLRSCQAKSLTYSGQQFGTHLARPGDLAATQQDPFVFSTLRETSIPWRLSLSQR